MLNSARLQAWPSPGRSTDPDSPGAPGTRLRVVDPRTRRYAVFPNSKTAVPACVVCPL